MEKIESLFGSNDKDQGLLKKALYITSPLKTNQAWSSYKTQNLGNKKPTQLEKLAGFQKTIFSERFCQGQGGAGRRLGSLNEFSTNEVVGRTSLFLQCAIDCQNKHTRPGHFKTRI
jgi:hypothetical protein